MFPSRLIDLDHHETPEGTRSHHHHCIRLVPLRVDLTALSPFKLSMSSVIAQSIGCLPTTRSGKQDISTDTIH